MNWQETAIPVGKGPEGFDVTPDGRELLGRRVARWRLAPISDLDAGDLLVPERETRRELKRIKLEKEPAGILIVTDGSRAYVAVTGDDNVAVIDLKRWNWWIGWGLESGRIGWLG
jgi:DNA-binding beta-propeller fold protein YncE